MREIIKNVTATATYYVVVSGLESGLTIANLLGVLNKTKGKVLYTPLKYGYASIDEISTGVYQIEFSGEKVFTVGDEIFLKFYVDTVESDAATDIKTFFGIVKDGDTVKVVTEDGGEEVVEPVGLMDEDDVYDYLEDIAVLMGGITAQQAASITAATRAIIHGGSGSGEGGEGGSGSGSGE